MKIFLLATSLLVAAPAFAAPVWVDEGCASSVEKKGDAYIFVDDDGITTVLPKGSVTMVDPDTVIVNGVEMVVPADDNGVCD